MRWDQTFELATHHLISNCVYVICEQMGSFWRIFWLVYFIYSLLFSPRGTQRHSPLFHCDLTTSLWGRVGWKSVTRSPSELPWVLPNPRLTLEQLNHAGTYHFSSPPQLYALRSAFSYFKVPSCETVTFLLPSHFDLAGAVKWMSVAVQKNTCRVKS